MTVIAAFPIISGNLKVKIADNDAEITQAQRLRYNVFCTEMNAKLPQNAVAEQRDFDEFDDVCDHLLVLEVDEISQEERVVGTYRLLRQEPMKKIGRFYSEDEFDISKLKINGGNIMELGRSCVHADFRTKQTMQLLWKGIGAYITHHNVDLMFGCASFVGVDIAEHRLGLAYLDKFHKAPENICQTALPDRYVKITDNLPDDMNKKRIFMSLPVLIKAYLRVGGYIGDGAVIDHDFNTIDVGIIVETEKVIGKYANRYVPDKKP